MQAKNDSQGKGKLSTRPRSWSEGNYQGFLGRASRAVSASQDQAVVGASQSKTNDNAAAANHQPQNEGYYGGFGYEDHGSPIESSSSSSDRSFGLDDAFNCVTPEEGAAGVVVSAIVPRSPSEDDKKNRQWHEGSTSIIALGMIAFAVADLATEPDWMADKTNILDIANIILGIVIAGTALANLKYQSTKIDSAMLGLLTLASLSSALTSYKNAMTKNDETTKSWATMIPVILAGLTTVTLLVRAFVRSVFQENNTAAVTDITDESTPKFALSSSTATAIAWRPVSASVSEVTPLLG